MASTDLAKQAIQQELESAIRLSVKNFSAGGSLSSDVTQAICTVIEAIFIHGLRDAFFLKGSRTSKRPSPNFWPFISKYTHRSIIIQIASLSQIRSEIGKARAWVRIVLNESALEHYIDLFSRDQSQLSRFYQKSAFIRDNECIHQFNGCLKVLGGVKLQVPTNSSLLNAWTPSPLALAGLIEKAALHGRQVIPTQVIDDYQQNTVLFKIGSPTTSSVAGEELETELEMGMNAIDLLGKESLEDVDNEDAPPSTSVSCAFGAKKLAGSIAGDDLESIYSHPSMLEEDSLGLPNILSPFNVSSSCFSKRPHYLNMLDDRDGHLMQHAIRPKEELSTEVVVYRRNLKRHRKRNISRNSDGGTNSDGGGSSQYGHDLQASTTEHVIEAVSACSEEETANPNPIRSHEAEDRDGDDGTPRRSNEELDLQMAPKNPMTELEPLFEVENARLISQVIKTPQTWMGTSLEEELMIALQTEKDALEDESEELARKKYSATEEQSPSDQMLKVSSRGQPSDIFGSSLSCSSDSDGITPTFDEALREFLGNKNAADRRTANRHSTSDKRLFSECSSTTLDDNASDKAAHIGLPPQSPSASSVVPFGVIENSAQSISSTTSLSFLHRSTNELPQSPFQKVQDTSTKEEEFVEISPPPNAEERRWSIGVGAEEEPYRLQKSLYQLTKLPQELGLDSQAFRCASCRRNIGVSFGPFKSCALNGRYYCLGHCIKPGTAESEGLIPARVLLNGDFRPRTISRHSRLLLKSIADQPFMRLNLLVPDIYNHCAQLRKIKDLRLKFSLLVLYLLSCKDSIAEDIKRRIWPHAHLHTDIHAYSIADLESVSNGTLERRLNTLIAFAQTHVQSCRICLQRGFFCELCNGGVESNRPIYPFQTETTYRCQNCSSVFHKECANRAFLDAKNAQNCPKCLRRAKYSSCTAFSYGVGSTSLNSIVPTSASPGSTQE